MHTGEWGGDLTNIEHCVPRPYNSLERQAVRPVPPLVGQHVEVGRGRHQVRRGVPALVAACR